MSRFPGFSLGMYSTSLHLRLPPSVGILLFSGQRKSVILHGWGRFPSWIWTLAVLYSPDGMSIIQPGCIRMLLQNYPQELQDSPHPGKPRIQCASPVWNSWDAAWFAWMGSISLGCSGISLLEQGQLRALEYPQKQLEFREMKAIPCALRAAKPGSWDLAPSSKIGMSYSLVSPHSKDLPGTRNYL